MGFAFASQQVGSLPVEPFDMPLDAVVTEKGYRRFRPASRSVDTPSLQADG